MSCVLAPSRRRTGCGLVPLRKIIFHCRPRGTSERRASFIFWISRWRTMNSSGFSPPEVDDRGGQPAGLHIPVQADADGVFGAVAAEGAEGAFFPGFAAVGGFERGFPHIRGIAAARLEFVGPGQVELPAFLFALRFRAGQLDDILPLFQPCRREFHPAIAHVIRKAHSTS